ncbi:MAG TPA: UbiA family prenyltransferase [Stellaceae bacterium]|nr:UbiA family prenyltransferase [Stellaceae bacterium]
MASPHLEISERTARAPLADDGAEAARLPLVVDLDRTLIATDSLQEQLAACLFRRPLVLLRALPHLLRGRAALKAALAGEGGFSPEALPLRDDLVEWLRGEAAKGRPIHLCTASNQAVAQAMADRVGVFASATGSGMANLKGKAKAAHLVRSFPEGFCYAGDSRADLAVWREADRIVLAGASPAVARAARRLGKPIEAEFANQPLGLADALKALRVHHWSKNALIFVPLILGHGWSSLHTVASTALGLLCLLLATSATYLINDIADLEADRRHWSKRHRALASGRMSLTFGFAFAVAALAVAMATAFLLAVDFALTLSTYIVLTLAYSFGLKRVPLLDTLIIGILFTSRLAMGIALAGHDYSEWLLTFSVFFFFSLAIAKRHTEIVRAGDNVSHALDSRGYRIEDGPLTLVLGVSASLASLVIMALFIVEQVRQRNLYGHPSLLWGIPLLLSIWIGRVWLLAHRGEMTDDPVSFALRDWASWLLGGAVAAVFLAAL